MKAIKKKCNIILTGFMGSGKTYFGNIIARKLRLDFYDTDEIIKNKCNMSINDIFKINGEKHFRDLEFKTCKFLSRKINSVISLGGGTLDFDRNLDLFVNNSIIIFLDIPFEICYNRSLNTDRPLLNVLTKAELYGLYSKRREKQIKIANFIVKSIK